VDDYLLEEFLVVGKLLLSWPVHVGLARGYSATGDYKTALKHAELALPQAPDDINRKSLTDAVARLKQGQDMNATK